jgi:hypothetical protein
MTVLPAQQQLGAGGGFINRCHITVMQLMLQSRAAQYFAAMPHACPMHTCSARRASDERRYTALFNCKL